MFEIKSDIGDNSEPVVNDLIQFSKMRAVVINSACILNTSELYIF